MAGNRRGGVRKTDEPESTQVRCKAQNRSTEFWMKEERDAMNLEAAAEP